MHIAIRLFFFENKQQNLDFLSYGIFVVKFYIILPYMLTIKYLIASKYLNFFRLLDLFGSLCLGCCKLLSTQTADILFIL